MSDIAHIAVRQPLEHELGAIRALRHQVLLGKEPTDNGLDPSTDDLESTAIHVAAFNRNLVVSPVRADPNPSDPTVYCISRMVTQPDHRGQGIGAKVLRAVEGEALRRGAKGFVLFSRPESVGYYEKSEYWNTQIVLKGDFIMVKRQE